MAYKDRLIQAMNFRKISQSELSEKSKIDKSTISGYINGRFMPKIQRTKLFAKILNVNPDWLLGDSDQMEIQKVTEFSQINRIITEENKKILRDRLLSTMISKNLKQEELSILSNVPIEVITSYLIGSSEIDFKYIQQLANTLEVLPEFLIGEDRLSDLQILARKMNKLDKEKFQRALELVDSIIDNLEKIDDVGE